MSQDDIKIEDIEKYDSGLVRDETERLEQFKKNQEVDRSLKVCVASGIGVLLFLEIAVVAIVIFFQGFKYSGFSLDPWFLGIFSNVVVLQTFFLVRNIVFYLFPSSSVLVKSNK